MRWGEASQTQTPSGYPPPVWNGDWIGLDGRTRTFQPDPSDSRHMVITFVWSLLGIQLQIDTRKDVSAEEEEDSESTLQAVTGSFVQVGDAEPPGRHTGFVLPSTGW